MDEAARAYFTEKHLQEETCETEKPVKTAVKMAVEIKRRFNEDGIFDYELNKEFTEFVYENAIFVSFDADDIPEMVEDEMI